MATKTTGTEKRLSLDKIKRARDVQPRVAMDNNVVKDYAERVEAGEKFPPVDVFFDGETHWAADGFHRLAGHEKAGRKQIDCIVHPGTKADAQWHALQSNKDHGLRRSVDDKKRAVLMAFEHPKGKDMSDRRIADVVGVSPTMVAKYRPKPEPTANGGQSKKRVGRDGRITKVGNIGKTKTAKSKLDAQPKAEKPAVESIGAIPAVAAIVAAPAQTQPCDDSIAARDDDHPPLEPKAVQPATETDEPEFSKYLLEDIELLVIVIRQDSGKILRRKEVLALPRENNLIDLLHRLDVSAQNIAAWLASQRAQPGRVSQPDTIDHDDADELAQEDADEDNEPEQEDVDEEADDEGDTDEFTYIYDETDDVDEEEMTWTA
ncbi:MAG: hypothetical protein WCJ35_11640 [Planctomycetota bacterium]